MDFRVLVEPFTDARNTLAENAVPLVGMPVLYSEWDQGEAANDVQVATGRPCKTDFKLTESRSRQALQDGLQIMPKIDPKMGREGLAMSKMISIGA